MDKCSLLKNYFEKNLFLLLQQFSEIAFEHNFKLFLVGGIVRDLLLNQKSIDIDILVEGNALEFVNTMQNIINCKILQIQDNLKTAKIKFQNNYKIDFASTREETYPQKGHLPKIETIGCKLEKDVLRRDFTINTIYISLNKNNFGDIIDFLDGQNDIKNKTLKILHNESFIDDPSRILRGLKFSERLNFTLDKQTLKLQNQYLQDINENVSYFRIKSELIQTLNLNKPSCIDKFIQQNIYKLFFPKVNIIENISILPKLTNKYKINKQNIWIVYFILLFINNKTDLENIKLELTKKEKDILEHYIQLIHNRKQQKNNLEIILFFKKASIEAILAYYIKTQDISALLYIEKLSKIKIEINGKDLINLGLLPSILYKKIFDTLLEQRANALIQTKEEEILFVKKNYLKKI